MWNFKLSYIRADLIDMTQIHSKIRDHQISEILVIGVMTLLIHTAVHICLGVEYSIFWSLFWMSFKISSMSLSALSSFPCMWLMIISFVTGKSNPPSKFAILEAPSLSSSLYDITYYSRFITPDVAFSILTSMFDLSPNLLSYENIINYIGGCNIYWEIKNY